MIKDNLKDMFDENLILMALDKAVLTKRLKGIIESYDDIEDCIIEKCKNISTIKLIKTLRNDNYSDEEIKKLILEVVVNITDMMSDTVIIQDTDRNLNVLMLDYLEYINENMINAEEINDYIDKYIDVLYEK